MANAIICISSHVARGAVGNRAMLFALERLGFAVWAVPTVLLPYHPGHGPATRIVPDDSLFAGLLQDLMHHDRVNDVAGIISGYLASPAQAKAIAGLVKSAKTARSDLLYLCDPVIGDTGKLYVADALAGAIRDELLPLADIATPNAFECAWLAGADPMSADFAVPARALPPATALVTSVPALMRGHIGNLLVENGDTILLEHPSAATGVKGSGDLLAALFLAWRLQGDTSALAAEKAIASVFEIVAATARAGGDELMLSQFQEAIVSPRAPVSVRRMR